MASKKLEELEKKRDQLNARIQQARARENAKRRKHDTTAKVLLGAALLKRIEENDSKAIELLEWCQSVLTERDRERLDNAMTQRK